MLTPNEQQQILSQTLKRMSVSDMAVGSYGRTALHRILGAVDYHLEIYRRSLDKILECCSLSPAEMVLVDYGGGHGLLSIMAKLLGFGQVVYIDANPEVMHTARQLSRHLCAAPDVMLQGEVAELWSWCDTMQVRPHALMAMDVIEHVYVLDDFFAALHSISPAMTMLFTTSATPYNKRVMRKLHHAMNVDEYGPEGKSGYRLLRKQYISRIHPDMSDKQLNYWAENTRGLTYEDVERAVEAMSPNLLLDPYNTCDPATGIWSKRILPIDDYRHLLAPYGFRLSVLPGRYNDHRRGPREWASRYYNSIIDKSPWAEPRDRRERRRYKKALGKAPFIYLVVQPVRQ